MNENNENQNLVNNVQPATPVQPEVVQPVQPATPVQPEVAQPAQPATPMQSEVAQPAQPETPKVEPENPQISKMIPTKESVEEKPKKKKNVGMIVFFVLMAIIIGIFVYLQCQVLQIIII